MSKGLKQLFFFKKYIPISNRYIKRCSTSLVIRQMQIKTTASYQFTSVRKSILIKTRDTQTLVKMLKKVKLCALLVET